MNRSISGYFTIFAEENNIMSIAFNTLRTNKKYKLTNYGEQYEFSVTRIISDTEFFLKDLHTLEEYYMSEVIRQGKGKDFSIWEI